MVLLESGKRLLGSPTALPDTLHASTPTAPNWPVLIEATAAAIPAGGPS